MPEVPGNAQLLIRPDSARILGEGEEAVNVVSATVSSISFRGRYQKVIVNVDSVMELTLEFDAGAGLPAQGSAVRLAIEPSALVLLRAQNEA